MNNRPLFNPRPAILRGLETASCEYRVRRRKRDLFFLALGVVSTLAVYVLAKIWRWV